MITKVFFSVLGDLVQWNYKLTILSNFITFFLPYTVVNSANAGLIGVVLLARHGDRSGTVFQNYTTYSSTQGYLSAYGSSQEYELGTFLRETYLNPSGGNVILDSAYALLQGLYPPMKESKTALANGQTVTSPLGGYQYIPVESLEFWQAPSLTSWMECKYFQLHLSRLNSGVVFKDAAANASPFLQAFQPYLNGLNGSFLNMWNIYDYLNVQYTHNETFYKSFLESLLEQARHFANIHEQNVFTNSVQNGVVTIQTLWPEIFWSLGNMTLPNNKVKLVVQEVDYKPFISLFNVMNATVTNPEISGSADYASAVALELSKNTAGEYSVALKFKNGTNDNEFQSLKMFGQDSLTFPQLVSAVPNDRWP
ncbi:hypothetical protein PAXINDRAFT_17548 [Paxillus involutus ATCC 200175]|uniref:Acid phosphatase n=1 Tax=Paxillus involutus ATCC 200175 TaxID=664439 RepID=A0A0C9TEH0_PAXIN|nr:hypothetical protein PAXINDRAFT_17548 [Paxillus involutus ATCC 200175]